MRYYKVPINDGLMDVDYRDVIIAHVTSDLVAMVGVGENAKVRDTWVEQTEDEWNTHLIPVQDLNAVKGNKLEELEQAYQTAFTTFQSSALGVVKTYPISQEAQDQFKQLQSRLIADPNKDSFYFLTIEDGVLVNHTRAQFLKLLDDAESAEVNIHNKYRGYVNQVNAATDEATVNAIVWS